MPTIVQLALIGIIGYLWGSIPAGYWIGKLIRGKDFDIRAYGSHKIGMTNVLRTLGRGPALFVLIFDLSKRHWANAHRYSRSFFLWSWLGADSSRSGRFDWSYLPCFHWF